MEILKGVPVANHLVENLKERIAVLKRTPKLVIFRATDEEGALSYETGATKRMAKVGILCETRVFPETVAEEDFVSAVRDASMDDSVDGILVLKPLPKEISEAKVNAAIAKEKDADAVTDENRLAVFSDAPGVRPCTPESVLRILDYYGVDLTGKNCVVIGRSLVVGKPLSMMLLRKNATVTICHTKTVNLPEICRQADVLVTAIGKPEIIDGSYVKDGAVVIDVGISVNAEGKLCGDCLFSSISEKAAMATPVPGGVGSVTTTLLASHVVESAEKRSMGDNA